MASCIRCKRVESLSQSMESLSQRIANCRKRVLHTYKLDGKCDESGNQFFVHEYCRSAILEQGSGFQFLIGLSSDEENFLPQICRHKDIQRIIIYLLVPQKVLGDWENLITRGYYALTDLHNSRENREILQCLTQTVEQFTKDSDIFKSLPQRTRMSIERSSKIGLHSTEEEVRDALEPFYIRNFERFCEVSFKRDRCFIRRETIQVQNARFLRESWGVLSRREVHCPLHWELFRFLSESRGRTEKTTLSSLFRFAASIDLAIAQDIFEYNISLLKDGSLMQRDELRRELNRCRDIMDKFSAVIKSFQDAAAEMDKL